jgi:hypothetical protein
LRRAVAGFWAESLGVPIADLWETKHGFRAGPGDRGHEDERTACAS